jgi:gas vesicle protein
MSKALRFMGGFLLGATVGAGVILLFAPGSGEETRQAIQDRVQEILDESRSAAEARRLELTTQFETLKQPIARTEEST